jgi:hypothetical protein
MRTVAKEDESSASRRRLLSAVTAYAVQSLLGVLPCDERDRLTRAYHDAVAKIERRVAGFRM